MLIRIIRDFMVNKKFNQNEFIRLCEERGIGIYVTARKFPRGEVITCRGFLPPRYDVTHGFSYLIQQLSSDLSEVKPDDVTIEISVLSAFELLKTDKPSHYLYAIHPGKDGVMVKNDGKKGILLPQACIGKDVEELLCIVCAKAGLKPDSWLDHRTKVYRFTVQIFTERCPGKGIVEIEPNKQISP